MVDKNSIMQIFGSLMKHPQYLSETDRYNLTLDDFYYKFDKYVFAAIDNLYRNGAQRIQPIDVENYLQTNAAASTIFKNFSGTKEAPPTKAPSTPSSLAISLQLDSFTLPP